MITYGDNIFGKTLEKLVAMAQRNYRFECFLYVVGAILAFGMFLDDGTWIPYGAYWRLLGFIN